MVDHAPWGVVTVNNLQVTKALSTRVGTSETIRLLSTKSNHNSWNEWLAGLIDGDGSFNLSKKGYARLEITMDIRDSHCLHQVKQKFGGSIKLRSGAKAMRYRLHHKSGLLSLINSVNGLIRNPDRMVQLEKICNAYDIIFIYPKPLIFSSGWFAGFFDANNKFYRGIHTSRTLSKGENNLVVWGTNMGSGISQGRITKQVSEMYQFNNYQHSVVIGMLLSDAWVIYSKGGKNPRLGFKRPLFREVNFLIFLKFLLYYHPFAIVYLVL